MKWIFAFVALMLSFSASSQNPFEVKSERMEDKSVRIWAEKSFAGKITVALTFKKLENTSFYGDGIYTVGSANLNLERLRPIDADSHIGYSYSYRWFYGDVEAEPDTTFVYRLPVSTQKLTNRRNVVDMYDLYLKNENRLISSSVFDAEPTDTIYAARKGVVVRIETQTTEQSKSLISTTERAYVTVEHADGSYAFYKMLNPNAILVEVGQTVYPDTPIGFPWSFEGERYLFFFEVCDYVWTERGVKAEYQRFIPLFKTDLGVTHLRHGVEYRAVVDDELVEREMTSREKKRRRRQ